MNDLNSNVIGERAPMNRAENRHHAGRKKAKAAKIVQDRYGDFPFGAREIGMTAATPAPCSCWMCGHQRKWNGPRFSEIRQRAVLEED